jgi:hypothetical protein
MIVTRRDGRPGMIVPVEGRRPGMIVSRQPVTRVA